MDIVTVKKLTKKYETFLLNDVSFSLKKGHIIGFIGRNGAGKTTTIKAMLNLISFTGEVNFFEKSFSKSEIEIKKEIGYSNGVIERYPRKKFKNIVNVTRRFYDSWDQNTYEKYLRIFELDENKTPKEMSQGMKVKANLLLSLSHKPKILILDEPTSGLDPFSRKEILNIFSKLKNDGLTIFFSTHIISDLEKSADDIVYISHGKIIEAIEIDTFKRKYSLKNESLEDIILRLEEVQHD